MPDHLIRSLLRAGTFIHSSGSEEVGGGGGGGGRGGLPGIINASHFTFTTLSGGPSSEILRSFKMAALSHGKLKRVVQVW